MWPPPSVVLHILSCRPATILMHQEDTETFPVFPLLPGNLVFILIVVKHLPALNDALALLKQTQSLQSLSRTRCDIEMRISE